MKTVFSNFLVRYRLGILFAMACVFFFFGLFSMRGDSATVDEQAHIPAGYSYLKIGDYRLNPEHPPLVKLLSGFSLMSREFFMDKNFTFPDGQNFWQTESNPQWQAGDVFLYGLGNDADEILLWARLPILFLGIGTLIYMFFVVEKYTQSTIVALLASFLFAFSPNILAHSRYVTTDIGATLGFLLAIDFWIRFIQKKTWISFISFSVAFCVAILLKFSVVLLVPVMMIFWVVYNWAFFFSSGEMLKHSLVRGLICVGIFIGVFFIMVTLVYWSIMYQMPVEVQITNIQSALPENTTNAIVLKDILIWFANNPVLRYVGYFFTGLVMVGKRVSGGNVVFLLGEIKNGSFWYYFPVSFFLKESLAYIILFLTTIVYFVTNFVMKKSWNQWKVFLTEYPFEVMLWMVVLVYWVVSISGNLNLGIRHILPILPMMYILVSLGVVKMWRDMKLRYEILGVLLLWYGLIPFLVYPSFLSYTNEMVGGQENGYMIFTDSNLDWGQDLKRLSNWTKEKEISKIYLDYFGGGDPEYYLGSRFIPLSSDTPQPSDGYVAVSATYIQHSFYVADTENEPSYEWLTKTTPLDIVGGSILIYDIK